MEGSQKSGEEAPAPPKEVSIRTNPWLDHIVVIDFDPDLGQSEFTHTDLNYLSKNLISTTFTYYAALKMAYPPAKFSKSRLTDM